MPVLLALVALLAVAPSPVGAAEDLWQLLKGGGQVVMMRHTSTAPGTGDPAGFTLDDCRTQRNLSAAGRAEARRIGAAFRARGIPVGDVLSSRWCRCLETALLAFDQAEPWPALDSFLDDRSREPAQMAAVRLLAGRVPERGNLILVTHQVNITAATGVSPSPGEVVVLTPTGNGEFRVAGRLRPSALSLN